MAVAPHRYFILHSLFLRILAGVFCCALLVGCGSWRPFGDPAPEQRARAPLTAQDSLKEKPPSAAPGATPEAPPRTSGAAATAPAAAAPSATPRSTLPYDVKILGPDTPGTPGTASSANAPDAAAVAAALKDASLLEKLRPSPPEDMAALEFRIAADETEARRLLRAFGFYEGTVQRTLDASSTPLRVTLTLDPGPLYRLAPSCITYVDAPADAPPPQPGTGNTAADAPPLPSSLQDLGLAPGAPAVAGNILDAVDNIPTLLAQRGYPMGKVLSTHYYIDKTARTLCAAIEVQAGPRARMGVVRMRGESRVSPGYVQQLRPWEEGRLWDQRQVEDYRDTLTRLGLFRSIQMRPAPAGASGNGGFGPQQTASAQRDTLPASSATAAPPADIGATPVYDLLLDVADAPQRTVGGGVRYETDRGVGVQAYWEDRNWLGNGERLRAEGGVWQDTQVLRLSLRKPEFFRRDQAFTAETWLRNEDTDAYRQRALWAGAGLERRLAPGLTASIGLSGEGGDLKDSLHALKAYTMASLPLSLRYDAAGNPLDSVRGIRTGISLRPTTGWYGDSFSVLPVRVDMSGYIPVLRLDDATERLVLAMRVAAGSLLRNDAAQLPAAIRWYGGGGGSVRGYAYQSLGPRENGDPLGGASFLELSAEARLHVTKAISVVPFVDGGNIYPDAMPDLSRDGLQWGAGIGLRYDTPIGPLRLDVATPLNPRKDDGPLCVYLSIGQSF